MCRTRNIKTKDETCENEHKILNLDHSLHTNKFHLNTLKYLFIQITQILTISLTQCGTEVISAWTL